MTKEANILIKTRGVVHKINVMDICYVISKGRRVKIRCIDREFVLCMESKECKRVFEGYLHACGSSLFVNFGWVNRIGDFKVCFECGDEIEMGHNRYYRLKASYVKSMGLLTGEKLKIYDAGIPIRNTYVGT